MIKPTIYLDHAATSPTRKEVVDAMMPFLTDAYGNPSSLHHKGREAHKALASAREQVASLLSAGTPESILFTSGGTEANNMALKGIAFSLREKGRHIITSQIEHPSVLEPCAWLKKQGWEIIYLPVDGEGRVSPDDLIQALRPDTVLVSLIHGNNEVGTLQPITDLGNIIRCHGAFFHVDAVQTVGKLPLNLTDMPVDLLSCSAHKFYGPKGVGFLYANEKARQVITPWVHGGGQQEGLRSGTENLAGIVGLAKALELVLQDQRAASEHLYTLQQRLMEGILHHAPSARLNGPRHVRDRVPGHINFSFPPVEGESLVLRFDLEGICVSSGSACHSGQLTGSHVLQAMGATEAETRSSVRFTLGIENTQDDVDTVLSALPKVLKKAGYFRHPTITATMG